MLTVRRRENSQMKLSPQCEAPFCAPHSARVFQHRGASQSGRDARSSWPTQQPARGRFVQSRLALSVFIRFLVNVSPVSQYSLFVLPLSWDSFTFLSLCARICSIKNAAHLITLFSLSAPPPLQIKVRWMTFVCTHATQGPPLKELN